MIHTHEALGSFLDNDLYKFTMQNAVLKNYKDIPVVYHFINRKKDSFKLNKEAVQWIKKQIQAMENLYITEDELSYISKFPFFDAEYIEYLAHFRYRPSEQIKIDFDNDTSEFSLEVVGSWPETILYETPLLSLISEAYFKFVDKDWTYDNQYERARSKAENLLENGCQFFEFGTRRRRSLFVQDCVMRAFSDTRQDYITKCQSKGVHTLGEAAGTSNVHLAKKYNFNAVGTVAHEFFMGISALEGIQNVNKKALDIWQQTYKGALAVALTDTYTTPVFLQDFQHKLASEFTGVRHDSGDPEEFAKNIVNHYKSLNIEPCSKKIIFSDGLDVDRAISLHKCCDDMDIQSSFGIGTHFSNDFEKASNPADKSKSMSIVIKLKECNGIRVIKLSDDVSKHSGNQSLVDSLEKELGIVH
ncbi:nicotinate phosphoribosyltransferase [Phycomyces nitens]|nr:nicotinate phosphoribosyltransferase [Phycomyces nitens]